MGKLYDGAWVIVAGQPLALQAIERLRGIFSVAGELYREDGRPLPKLFKVPAIQMVLDADWARENGLIAH
ncbi:hypothetical protein [Asticcacaulis sp. YBE204]|uniref:hypothetical protein n=1 Tax=Asticcacaulis sp. YBE204 TaxID=1282363 RepID=UPI0003C3F792|nr:hypothetical protein [Asticcacaulis sp. YBE204]ESQ79112.1 hypothetical protein AEYBE204_10685 [Asticcacaulis sp. YBE204]